MISREIVLEQSVDRIATARDAKRRKVKAPAYYRARQWLILD